MTDVVSWICTESGTQLVRLDADGARCGHPTHWHARRRSGFVAAHPMPPVTYRTVSTEAPPLPTPSDQTESEHE